MIKKTFSILSLFLIGLLSIGFSNAQDNTRLSRNIFIDIYTPQSFIVGFKYKSNQGFSEYKPKVQTNYGFNNQIIIPKGKITHKDTNWKMKLKVNIDKKVQYVNVEFPFNSIEEINQKNKILLYIGNKDITKDNTFDLDNLITKKLNGLYVISNENINISSETIKDINAKVIFPNILGIRKFHSVWLLAGILFIISCSFLIYKKEVIKL